MDKLQDIGSALLAWLLVILLTGTALFVWVAAIMYVIDKIMGRCI